MTLLQNYLRRALLPGAAMIALIALANAANAQITSAEQSAIRSNCRSDFTSKCSGVTPGGKDALNCLQKNVASLSPGCKTAVSATIPAPAAPAPVATQPAPAAPAPAQSTITRAPPPAATPARPAPKPQQAKKPAAPPKQAVVAPPAAAAPAGEAPAAPTPKQLSALKFTCKRDFQVRCKGVPTGGPEAFACLQRNAARLTPDCKTSLAAIDDAGPAPAPSAAPVAVTAAPAGGGFVPGGILIRKACARYLLMHCSSVGLGTDSKVACLVAYAKSGKFIGPRCKAVLEMTGHLR